MKKRRRGNLPREPHELDHLNADLVPPRELGPASQDTAALLRLGLSDAEIRCPRKAGAVIGAGRCEEMRAEGAAACYARSCPIELQRGGARPEPAPPHVEPARRPAPRVATPQPTPPDEETTMAGTKGKTAADYTCRACGQSGHTARNKDCPAHATKEAPAPKKRSAKSAPAVEPDAVEVDATAIAKKLHWAIRGACDGHLTLDQLSDLASADDVRAVVG